MERYVLDSNVYIRATRDESANRELEAFVQAYAPQLYLHSVVAMEVLVGATQLALERRTRNAFIRPFERRGRVLTPSHAVYIQAAAAIVTLIRRKRISADGIGRSFLNDCLLAASARERGFVLVTDNEGDFELLREVLRFRFVRPWPGETESSRSMV